MFRYTLRSLLTTSAVMLAVTITVGLSAVSERVAADHFKRRIGQQLANRSAELADKLDRGLYERYQDIRLLGQALPEQDPLNNHAKVREQLNRLRAAYEGYAWIGFAARDGRVLAATDGLLEGADVSLRPWFTKAFASVFVGDVHQALLLEKKLNAGGSEPLRFLDISVPVMQKDSTFMGVVGANIDWRWVKGIRITLPGTKRSEALLVSSNHTVLLGPDDLQDKPLSIESVRLAKNGTHGFHIERWPDGKTYLTGYSKSNGYRDYPGLDWIVLERQEISEAFTPVQELTRQLMIWGIVIAGLFALLGWFVAARIARPLNAITRAAELLQRGEKSEIPKTKSYREVTVLARTLRRLIGELTRRESELTHQATHHGLTQLPNRALVKAVLDQTIARLTETGGQVAVLTLNLDRFKIVNDTHGYEMGDAVLRATAERLAACIGSAGTLGHFSGDKFVMVLEDHDSTLLQTSKLASLARETIAMPFGIKDAEFFLTTSIGISLLPKDAQDAEALLAYSELALYQAKQQGGNCIEFYEARMNATVLARLDLERALRQALERQQLELHYQPQLSLTTGKIVGVEALVRWRHPERGLISPAHFIPVAEASGLIIPIGNWVLHQACAQARTWREQGLPPLRMGVNVSVQQFNAGDLVERVTEVLQKSGLEAGLLKLEITESLLMQEVEQSITTMHRLTQLGVKLAIDDFGTGYSSLAYLRRFPISELKIDQAFVRELTPLSGDTAIVRAIIALGHSLQLSVIAEGVETAEQLRFLRQAGCDEIQGYYFSRPVPADQIADLLNGSQRFTE